MDFTKLSAYLDRLSSVGVPGCDLAVWRDHEPLYRHQAGFRDAALTQPVRGDETYNLYSATKVFTTCAAMQLIERGVLSLDDPVSAYLPAYAQLTVKDGGNVRPARRAMTIRHLMSMQGGMDYDMASPSFLALIDEVGPTASTRQLVDAKAKDPLQFEPGTNFLYSVCHDVLAAVIEVASGKRFSEYLKENIFDPLGLHTVTFKPTPEVMARMAQQYEFSDEQKKPVPMPNDSNNYRLTPNYESGGAGLMADVADYIAFADALACGGVGKGGAHILSPEMIQLWSANQLGSKGRASFDEWQRLGYSYALGVRTRVSTAVGGRGQIGEFGWDGAAGAWTMIDPINHISAFYAMHVRNFGYCYDVIHPKIRDLIYEAVMG